MSFDIRMDGNDKAPENVDNKKFDFEKNFNDEVSQPQSKENTKSTTYIQKLLGGAVLIAFPIPTVSTMLLRFAYKTAQNHNGATPLPDKESTHKAELLSLLKQLDSLFNEISPSSVVSATKGAAKLIQDTLASMKPQEAFRSSSFEASSLSTPAPVFSDAENPPLSQNKIEAILRATFPHSSDEERKAIEGRLNTFSEKCEIPTKVMYERIQRGREVAIQIEQGTYSKPPSTQDVVDFEWFLRAQHAKMDSLYLKGTMKFPDPGNKIAAFLMSAQSTYHGETGTKMKAYPRRTSHWAERQQEIKQSVLSLPGGQYACFSKEQYQQILKENPHLKKEDVFFFEHPGVGIDATSKGNLHLSGENSNTVLAMFFSENDQNNQAIPMVALKNETYGTASVTQIGHGTLSSRAMDGALHLKSAIEKKGPKFLKKERTTVEGLPDRKEDVLPQKVSDLIQKINLKHPIVANKEAGQKLRELHRNLLKTTQIGSEYALPELKAYLEILLPHVDDKAEKDAIEALLAEIAIVNAQSAEISKDWEHQILPRSEEVILPTLGEMLSDKVPFK